MQTAMCGSNTYTDTYINDDGERVEFTCNHVQLSLTEEGDYNE